MDQPLPALGLDDMVEFVHCLSGAVSQNANEPARKEAEDILKSQEHRPGFCSCLLEAIATKDVESGARWLASTEFKNCVTRQWKPSENPGFLSSEEKGHLRGKLLTLMSETDNKIAVQLALAFGKIARCDYPKFWPNLFEDLLGKLGAQDTLTARRVYLVLHHVLKELSSKRLSSDQKSFAEVTGKLFGPLWSQWCTDTQAILVGVPAMEQAPATQPALLLTIERWLVLLKALRRMLLFGYPSDTRSLEPVPAVTQVLPILLQGLQAISGLRPQKPSTKVQLVQLYVMLDNGIYKLAKTMTNLLETHPWSFRSSGALEPSLLFFCGKLVESHQGGPRFDPRFCIQSMLFVDTTFKSTAYRGVVTNFDPGMSLKKQGPALKAMAAEMQKLLEQFWGGGRAETLCKALIEQYFPLTAKDLEDWESTPEQFHHESDLRAWQENVRSCAEVLYKSIFEFNTKVIAPLVMAVLKTGVEACPTGAAGQVGGPRVGGIPTAVLAKEAAYSAVGVCAFELHGFIEFGPWFRNTLVQEMVDAEPAAKPLRRRAVLLIGQCVPNLLRPDRPMAYNALLANLAAEDPAFKMAAVTSLHALVEDWDFDVQDFLPYASSSFQLLIAFLQDADEFDTSLQVFTLINLIIDRLADEVKPYAEGIMAALPGIWQSSEGMSMLRIQILIALQRLVMALGKDSPATYPLVVPVLQLCTSITQPDELNLLEDGLGLWLITLRNAPAPTTELLDLFPNLIGVMERSTEHILVGSKLLTSLILLGGGAFLVKYGVGVAGIMCSMLGNVNERGMLLMLPVMEMMVQCYQGDAVWLLEPALQKLLGLVMGGKETGLVVSTSFAVFARILLQSPEAFPVFFSRAAAVPGMPAVAGGAAEPGQQLVLSFLDLWLDKFDSIAASHHRKLASLALCVLLTLPLPEILQRFGLIAAHITSVWFEVEGSGNGDQIFFGYDFFNARDSIDDDEASVHGCPGGVAAFLSEESDGESNRRKLLYEVDPVNTLKLSSFLKAKMQQCGAVHGDSFQAAFQRLDPSVSDQLKLAIK